MNAWTRKEYRHIRQIQLSHMPHVSRGAALAALKTAKQRYLIHLAENAGLIRIDTRPDELSQWGDLAGDCFNPEANPDIPRERLEREEQAEMERANHDGVWGIVSQYRTSPDGEWIDADSVWGFIGDDWRESGYEDDIMCGARDSLKQSLRDRCPCCRKPRRIA